MAQRTEHLPDREDVDRDAHPGAVGSVGVAPLIGQVRRILRHGNAFGAPCRARGRDQIDRIARRHRGRAQGFGRSVLDLGQHGARVERVAIARQMARSGGLARDHQRHAQFRDDVVQHHLRHGRIEMHEGPPVDHAGGGARGHGESGRPEDAHHLRALQMRRDPFGKAAQLAIGQTDALIRQGGAVLMVRDGADQIGGDGPGIGHGIRFLGVSTPARRHAASRHNLLPDRDGAICLFREPHPAACGPTAPARSERGLPQLRHVCRSPARSGLR